MREETGEQGANAGPEEEAHREAVVAAVFAFLFLVLLVLRGDSTLAFDSLRHKHLHFFHEARLVLRGLHALVLDLLPQLDYPIPLSSPAVPYLSLYRTLHHRTTPLSTLFVKSSISPPLAAPALRSIPLHTTPLHHAPRWKASISASACYTAGRMRASRMAGMHMSRVFSQPKPT